jgi:guanidinoacetate N-methyltransferase
VFLTDAEKKLEELRNMYSEVGFRDPEEWKNAPIVRDGHTIKIFGHPVMEDWEVPYMKKLAEIATSKGGHILEVGFGMGISAGFVQKADIKSHTIIEANRYVAEVARGFCKTARHSARVLEGLAREVIEQIPDGSLDAILHDAYPLDESEVMNQVHFAKIAHRKLKPGGIFTYFSDEVHRFKDKHMKQLLDAGFSKKNISGIVVPVNPPKECQYWNAPSVLAPIVIK